MGDVLQFDDPSLLRAARAADVLRGCGQLLASSAGTDDTFQLSSEVDRIDVFISHNWATRRAHKFLALAVHFNLVFATSVALPAVAVGVCFRLVVGEPMSWRYPLGHLPVICTLTVLVFYAALLFGHEAQAMLGFRGKRVFLDKACIHQTDDDRKQRGILSLGAFLHHSDSIVVCFTDLYLQKLWTVYEFACFLLVHGESCPGSVHIIPTGLPLLGTSVSLCFYVVYVLVPRVAEGFFSTDYVITDNVRMVVAILCFWVCAYWARGWASQQREARATFQRFELADTQCTAEPDRALVQANIISLMRRFAHVGVRAPDEEALSAFDEYMRTAIARAFAASVGRLGAPFRYYLPLQLVLLADSMDLWCMAVAAGNADHKTPAQCVFYLIAHFVSSFATLPLVGALCMRLGSCCPWLRGVAEVAYTGGVGVLSVVAFNVIDPTGIDPIGYLLQRNLLLNPALASPHSSAPFLLFCALLIAVTAFVYKKPQWKVRAAEVDGVSRPQGEPDSGSEAGGSVPDTRSDLASVAGKDVSVAVEDANNVMATPSMLVATPSGQLVYLAAVAL